MPGFSLPLPEPAQVPNLRGVTGIKRLQRARLCLISVVPGSLSFQHLDSFLACSLMTKYMPPDHLRPNPSFLLYVIHAYWGSAVSKAGSRICLEERFVAKATCAEPLLKVKIMGRIIFTKSACEAVVCPPE